MSVALAFFQPEIHYSDVITISTVNFKRTVDVKWFNQLEKKLPCVFLCVPSGFIAKDYMLYLWLKCLHSVHFSSPKNFLSYAGHYNVHTMSVGREFTNQEPTGTRLWSDAFLQGLSCNVVFSVDGGPTVSVSSTSVLL